MFVYLPVVYQWLYLSILRSLPSNRSLHHIAPSLRLFIPSSLQVYRHFFFSEGSACDICAWSHLPLCGSVFHGVYSPTTPAASFSRPLILSSSLIGCQWVQVYHHHPSPVGAAKSSESGQCSYIYGSCSVCCLFFCFGGGQPFHIVQSLTFRNSLGIPTAHLMTSN
jgi:hypothetical protein